MSDSPTVSVIIPVYNGARFLKACLDSLLAQTYPKVDITVVDDGSTDGSSELVKPPVKLLSTSGRTGAGAARNLGAGHASGDYLLFTDADVVVPPDWAERTVKTIAERNVLCGGGGYAGPVEDSFIQWFAHEELVWRRRHINGETETLVSNNLFCERELFLRAGGFPEAYCAASSEDMEFSWNISRTEKLWWDRDNGVYHNFTPTISAYLRQQRRFAEDAVPMILGNTGLVRGKTHHPKSFYLEIMLTGVLILCLLMLQPYPAIGCAILILILNRGLIFSMMQKNRRGFLLKTMSLIFMRNTTIIFGSCIGLFQLLRKRP